MPDTLKDLIKLFILVDFVGKCVCVCVWGGGGGGGGSGNLVCLKNLYNTADS